jgi:hypothetical protein
LHLVDLLDEALDLEEVVLDLLYSLRLLDLLVRVLPRIPLEYLIFKLQNVVQDKRELGMICVFDLRNDRLAIGVKIMSGTSRTRLLLEVIC